MPRTFQEPVAIGAPPQHRAANRRAAALRNAPSYTPQASEVGHVEEPIWMRCANERQAGFILNLPQRRAHNGRLYCIYRSSHQSRVGFVSNFR